MATDPGSVSERELAEDLHSELFGQPRSVGEAVAAAATDIEVEDEPQRDSPGDTSEAPLAEEPVAEPESEDTEEDTEEAEGEEGPSEAEWIAWAKKRWGDDPEQWARGAYEGQQHLSRIMNEKKEAEQIAVHWYEAHQEAQQQAATQGQMGMPLSAQEEAWVESVAVTNPLEAARAAALQGNVQLYSAVLERVASENAAFAAHIGTQVQMEMMQRAQQEAAQGQPRSDQEVYTESFQRVGVDVAKDGPAFRQKVNELGEYHPYVQAILYGDDAARDLGVRAVFDLTREGQLSKRRVRDESREEQVKREGELRRAAAGVVTGAPHTPPPEEDPLLAAMTEEWKARRQWGGD